MIIQVWASIHWFILVALNRYLSNGLATTKSDVYAFGVVLFELISGKEAITRTEGKVLVNPERRSLVSIVSSIPANFMPCCNLSGQNNTSWVLMFDQSLFIKFSSLSKHDKNSHAFFLAGYFTFLIFWKVSDSNLQPCCNKEHLPRWKFSISNSGKKNGSKD